MAGDLDVLREIANINGDFGDAQKVTLVSGETNGGIDLRNRDQFTQLPPTSLLSLPFLLIIGGVTNPA